MKTPRKYRALKKGEKIREGDELNCFVGHPDTRLQAEKPGACSWARVHNDNYGVVTGKYPRYRRLIDRAGAKGTK